MADSPGDGGGEAGTASSKVRDASRREGEVITSVTSKGSGSTVDYPVTSSRCTGHGVDCARVGGIHAPEAIGDYTARWYGGKYLGDGDTDTIAAGPHDTGRERRIGWHAWIGTSADDEIIGIVDGASTNPGGHITAVIGGIQVIYVVDKGVIDDLRRSRRGDMDAAHSAEGAGFEKSPRQADVISCDAITRYNAGLANFVHHAGVIIVMSIIAHPNGVITIYVTPQAIGFIVVKFGVFHDEAGGACELDSGGRGRGGAIGKYFPIIVGEAAAANSGTHQAIAAHAHVATVGDFAIGDFHAGAIHAESGAGAIDDDRILEISTGIERDGGVIIAGITARARITPKAQSEVLHASMTG